MSIDRRYRLLKSTLDTGDLTGSPIATGLLGTGTADVSVFLRGDSTWSNSLGPPSNGTSLTLRGVVGNTAFISSSPYTLTVRLDSSSTTSHAGIDFTDTATPKVRIGAIFTGSGSNLIFGTSNNYTNGITNAALTIGFNGNVTIAAPSAGQTLTVAPSPAAGELMATSAALTTGAGAAAGTLTNAPSAGNPTKWIKINDNGTVRSVPAW